MKHLFLILIIFLAGCTTTTDYQTGDVLQGDEFDFEVITNDLQNPWGMSFLSENKLFITQKNNGLVLLNLDSKEKTTINGLPEFVSPGQGGLLDVKYFDGFVYLTYVAENNNAHSTKLGRGFFNEEQNELIDFEVLHTSGPAMSGGAHFGSRILIHED